MGGIDRFRHEKQQIWMCFAPGIVKRMGTVEDFDVEIQRLIQSYLDGMAQSVSQAQKSAQTATEKANSASSSASQAQNRQNLPQAKLKNQLLLQTMLRQAKQKPRLLKPMLGQVRTVRLSLHVTLRQAKQILRSVKLMLRNQRLMRLQAQLTQKQ